MEVNLEFFQKAYRNPKEDVSQNYTGSSLPKKKHTRARFLFDGVICRHPWALRLVEVKVQLRQCTSFNDW